jgi:hypothetical protein
MPTKSARQVAVPKRTKAVLKKVPEQKKAKSASKGPRALAASETEPAEIAMMKSSIKALLLQCAGLAGLEVGPMCPEELISQVGRGIRLTGSERRPEAVGNLLRLLAATLQSAQDRGDQLLHEENVREGKEKVCPVFPFGKR